MTAAAKKTQSVDQLRKNRDAARARREEIAAELRSVAALTNPVGESHARRQSATRAEQLRARARETELRNALYLAEADAEDAEVAYRAAREEQRATDRKAALERLRPKLPELDAALANVAEILRAMLPHDIASGEQIVTGFALLLDDPDQLREGLITTWRQRCAEMGLL